MNARDSHRKVKAYKTGQCTIRKTTNNTYIIIAWFEGWRKAHAMDLSSGEPYKKGREYKSFHKAQTVCKKSLVNCKRRRYLDMPLATSDYFSKRIDDSPICEETE